MIHWTLNKTRQQILNHPARFKVIVAGRRWGKTILSLMYLLKEPFQPGERRWFITPTYRQGKMIVFPVLRQMFSTFKNAKLNESEMSVVFENGAELAVKGADNEHNLRGVELTKAVMDEMVFKQEFEGSFETTGNRAAWNFDRNIHCVKTKEMSNKLWWGCDFNVDYNTAVLCSEFTDGTIHFYDEVRLKNSNTDELALAMKKIAPNIECYPDPAGKARSTTSRRSDHQILRDHGFIIRTKNRHPSHIDRLNSLNRKLKDADGNISMTVDPKCKFLVKDLEQCQRDKRGGLAKDNIELTHALDACSYGIEYRFPIRRMIGTSKKW